MLVLVHEPGTSLGGARTGLAEIRVEKLEAVTERAEDPPAGVRDEASVPVVQSDEDVAAGPNETRQRAKRERRVGRVMEYAIADHEVERRGGECRPEQVHLHEVNGREMIALRELVSEPKRVEAEVRADDRAVRDGQEVAHLSGPAPRLEYAGAERDLLVEQSREQSAPRLLHEAADVVEVVVVRERRLLVEGADVFGDIGLRRIPLGGPVQLRNAAFRGKGVSAAAAAER